MTQERKQLGEIGEEAAASYFKAQGYKILSRNYRTVLGELDIVAEKDDTIVFIEVKTRRMDGNQEALPEDNITSKKQHTLRTLGKLYLVANHYKEGQEWQIDVLAVEVDPDSGATTTRHIEQAVTE